MIKISLVQILPFTNAIISGEMMENDNLEVTFNYQILEFFLSYWVLVLSFIKIMLKFLLV